MIFFQVRIWMIFLTQTAFYLVATVQSSLSLNKDSLSSSFKVLLETIEANAAYKEVHFLKVDEFDYFNSINSSHFVNDISKVLTKVELPFESKQIAEITFVKLYDWTEANSTWFITLIDKTENHYIYLYEGNTGMEKAHLYGIKQEIDFFYRLAENLYQSGECKEKNEGGLAPQGSVQS